jgi:2,3-bisphosphoglycerate-independent phosphoglycerate mutase
MNPVEVIVYGQGLQGKKMKETGRLADLAPTVLKLMGLKQPSEMTGDCLLVD